MYIDPPKNTPKLSPEEELRLKEILEKKIIEVENSLSKRKNKDKFIEILYALAKVIRNIEGKGPSTTGPEIGKLLMELRCLDGARYDKEVLLINSKVDIIDVVPGKVLDSVKLNK